MVKKVCKILILWNLLRLVLRPSVWSLMVNDLVGLKRMNEYSQSLCVIYKCQVDLVSGSCCLLNSLSTLQSLRGMLKFPMIVDWSVLPFSSARFCFKLFWSSSIKCIHIFSSFWWIDPLKHPLYSGVFLCVYYTLI